MKRYLRIDEVAEMLSISKATAWRYVSSGLLPTGFKPTQRTTLFDAEKVQAAINKMAGEA